MRIGSFWTTGIVPGGGPGKNPLIAANGPNSTASEPEIVDELSLSSEAEESPELPRLSDMHANRSTPNRSTRAAPGRLAAEIGQLEFNNRNLLAGFQTRFSDRLEQSNVDRDLEIQLTIAGDGQVVVTNDHPQKEDIESIFRDEPRLRDQFAQISAQESLLKAAQEAIAFQEAYRDDPDKAVQDFNYLFERKNPLRYSMLLAGDTVTAFFA